MRLLALALLLATPLAAQTVEVSPQPPLPDSAEALPELTTADLLGEAPTTEATTPVLTPYRSVLLSAGWTGTTGALVHASGALGAELPSGLRLGGRLSATTFGRTQTVAIGPEIRYARDLGRGYRLTTRGAGALALSTGSLGTEAYRSRQAALSGSVAVEREVPIVGSLRIAPSAGVYGTLARRSSLPQFDLDARTSGAAGVLLGADLRFRAFGRDVSVPLSLPLRVLGQGAPFDASGLPYDGSGLRIGL